MSSSSSSSNQPSTTLSPLDIILSYIRIPSVAVQLCFWGFLFTLVIGFIGNTLSLLTFLRPTLKNISTGCFFILLAISDMSRLLIFVIDFLEYGVQVRRIEYEYFIYISINTIFRYVSIIILTMMVFVVFVIL